MPDSRPHILVSDPIHHGGIELLEAQCRVTRTTHDKVAEVAEALRSADAVIVRGLQVTAALMDGAPRLKAVVKHGSGVNNIAIPAAAQRGIMVANTAGGANASAVAEGAVTLMLAVLRRTPETHASVLAGRFTDRWHFDLADLTGRTLGIVGFGKIGRATAKICNAGFGLPVIAYDPFVPAAEIAAAGYEPAASMEDVLRRADVVSIHTPYEAGTHHLIGAAQLRLMKPSAILVCTSRGGIVEEPALADALGKGVIAGAGIDVFEQEPPAPDNPLFKAPNIVLCPHMAGSTESSHHHSATEAAKAVLLILAGEKPKGLLTPEAWDSRRR